MIRSAAMLFPRACADVCAMRDAVCFFFAAAFRHLPAFAIILSFSLSCFRMFHAMMKIADADDFFLFDAAALRYFSRHARCFERRSSPGSDHYFRFRFPGCLTILSFAILIFFRHFALRRHFMPPFLRDSVDATLIIVFDISADVISLFFFAIFPHIFAIIFSLRYYSSSRFFRFH